MVRKTLETMCNSVSAYRHYYPLGHHRHERRLNSGAGAPVTKKSLIISMEVQMKAFYRIFPWMLGAAVIVMCIIAPVGGLALAAAIALVYIFYNVKIGFEPRWGPKKIKPATVAPVKLPQPIWHFGQRHEDTPGTDRKGEK
jgi:hypothetical protein